MTDNETIIMKPREHDKQFQADLKAVTTKWGINNYVFVGQYIESDVQTKDRAVTSIIGDFLATLRLVDALNNLIPELMVRQFLKEAPSIKAVACKDCPDKDTCEDRVIGKEKCNA
jgi:hypothetical protein